MIRTNEKFRLMGKSFVARVLTLVANTRTYTLNVVRVDIPTNASLINETANFLVRFVSIIEETYCRIGVVSESGALLEAG